MGKNNDMFMSMDIDNIRKMLLEQNVRFIDDLYEGYYGYLYVSYHMQRSFAGAIKYRNEFGQCGFSNTW